MRDVEEDVKNLIAKKGHYLDALVQEHVFGKKVIWSGTNYPISGEDYKYLVPDYSSDGYDLAELDRGAKSCYDLICEETFR